MPTPPRRRGQNALRLPPRGAEAEPEEIIAFVKERVAAYKYPRRVEIRDVLPKGPTGQILKVDLKREADEIVVRARRDHSVAAGREMEAMSYDRLSPVTRHSCTSKTASATCTSARSASSRARLRATRPAADDLSKLHLVRATAR